MRIIQLTLCLGTLLLGAVWAQTPVTANVRPDDVSTQEDFESRVSKYYDLRNKLGGKETQQTNSAQDAKSRQDQLAAKVRDQRATAKHEDIFSDKITELFKRQLKSSYRGGNGARITTSLAHAEPVPKMKLQVNSPYPEQAPLQSTPPTILQNLPRLPKGLEYRFVGRDLILYDSATNLIVDYIHEALPSR
jgi:hypothetical protein